MASKRKTKTKTKSQSRKKPSNKNNKKSKIQSNWKKISTGAATLAGLSNITSADMSASAGQPIGMRAQNFANSLLGRITGFTPFKNAAGANTPQTISIEGIFNKWSGVGLATWVYGQLPIKQLPHKAKAKTFGKVMITSGVLSGLFKPDSNPHSHNLVSHNNPSVTPTITSVSTI